MKLIKLAITLLIVTGLLSCASNQNMRDASNYKIPVNDFSRTVELLISNQQFLEDEIMKINSQNPSVQRILLSADSDLKKENYIKIIPASDPNGRFVTSLGFSSVRTSWAFRPLGLLGLSSVGTYGAFRLLGLLGLFVC